MAEVRREVRTYRVTLICDICGEKMKYDGDRIEGDYLGTYVVRHKTYRCSNGHEVLSDDNYPRIEYRDVTAWAPKKRGSGKDELCPNDLNIQHKYDSPVNIRNQAIDEMCEELLDQFDVRKTYFKDSGYAIIFVEAVQDIAARLKEKS